MVSDLVVCGFQSLSKQRNQLWGHRVKPTGEGMEQTAENIPIIGETDVLEPLSEEDHNTPVDLLDDDLNLTQELDLIDEEF